MDAGGPRIRSAADPIVNIHFVVHSSYQKKVAAALRGIH